MRTVYVPAPYILGTVGSTSGIAGGTPTLTIGGDEERTLAFCGEGHRIGKLSSSGYGIRIEAFTGIHAIREALYLEGTAVVSAGSELEDEVGVVLIKDLPPYLALLFVDEQSLGLLLILSDVSIVEKDIVVTIGNSGIALSQRLGSLLDSLDGSAILIRGQTFSQGRALGDSLLQRSGTLLGVESKAITHIVELGAIGTNHVLQVSVSVLCGNITHDIGNSLAPSDGTPSRSISIHGCLQHMNIYTLASCAEICAFVRST